MRRVIIAAALFVFPVALSVPDPALASVCYFGTRPPTLRESFANASLVVFGRLENARQTEEGGTTDVVTLYALRGAHWSNKKVRFSISRYIPVDPSDRYLLVLDLDPRHGAYDVYRAEMLTPAGLRYLAGLLALDTKDNQAILRWCFDYLNDADELCRGDALLEWSLAAPEDFAKVAPRMSADKLRGWLATEGLSTTTKTLFGLILGHCGAAKDGALLRGMLDPAKDKSSEGLLIGQVLLQPAEGWTYLRTKTRDKDAEFQVSFACVKAVRYLHNTRPNVVAARELVAALGDLLRHPQVADFAIEDLRNWKDWSLTDRVLGLHGAKNYEAPVIKRAILRYALQCPQDAARRFAAARRLEDPEFVKDMEELLKVEEPLMEN
jgi:hypothetical protein